MIGKKALLLLLLTIGALISYAQTLGQISQFLTPYVRASQGGYYIAGNVNIQYTIGETFTATYMAGGNECSMGFEQPELGISSRHYDSPFYPGASINLLFIANGIFDTSNVFTAQLSDSLGIFDTLGYITPITSMHAGLDSIWVIIPDSLVHGIRHKIRVISSNPIDTLISPVVIPLQANIVVTPDTCGGNIGGIAVSIINGVPPYHYNWLSLDSSGLSTGLYSITVSDSFNDSLVAFILMGNRVDWDTLVYLQDSSNNIIATATDSLSNGYCYGSDALYNGVSGWAQFTIIQGDTFQGALELTDSAGLIDFGQGVQVVLRADSIIINVHYGANAYNFYLGSYRQGSGYQFLFEIIGDSAYITQMDILGYRINSFLAYLPRNFDLTPKISGFKKASRLGLVMTNFCSSVAGDTISYYTIVFTDQSQQDTIILKNQLKFSSPGYNYNSSDSIYFKYRVVDPASGSEVVSASDVKYTSDGFFLADNLSGLTTGNRYLLEFLLFNGNRYSFTLKKN